MDVAFLSSHQDSYFSQRSPTSPKSLVEFQAAIAPGLPTPAPDEERRKILPNVAVDSIPAKSDLVAISSCDETAFKPSPNSVTPNSVTATAIATASDTHAAIENKATKRSSRKSRKHEKYEKYVPMPPGTFISSNAGMLRSEVQARLLVCAQRRQAREEEKELRLSLSRTAKPVSISEPKCNTEISVEPPSPADSARSKSRDTSKWSYSRKASRFWMKTNRELFYPYTKLGIAELDCFGAGLMIDATDWYTSPMEDRYPHLKAQKLSQSADQQKDNDDDADAKNEDAEVEYLMKKMHIQDRKTLVPEKSVVVDENIQH